MDIQTPAYRLSLHPFECIQHLMEPLCKRLKELDLVATIHESGNKESKEVIPIDFKNFIGKSSVHVFELLEHVIQQLPVEFENLPLLVEGESKIIRLLNSKIVVERFKPTVYSYTSNRYGEVEGTAELRVLFSAELFRYMNRYNAEERNHLKNAFIAVIHSADGPLLVQEKVETCNLEVRVKRYHIGSPMHRYKYVEKYKTVQLGEAPLEKWTRFDIPVVCFDWRHPLVDPEGNRLADEPISDDYAGIWMMDVVEAKNLARETFSWMERLFRDAGLSLVDTCFFIDRTGHKLYGEISPDCMRVREGTDNPNASELLNKGIEKQGEKEKLIVKRYHKLFHALFSQAAEI